MPQASKSRSRRARGGFTYLGVLLLLALLAALLAGVGQRTGQLVQRERERELLFRASQIRTAIESYRAVTPPGQPAQWPQSLQDLLSDTRAGPAIHHLRRLYADPFTGRSDWVLLMAPPADPPDAGGIVGLHSRAVVRRLLRQDGPTAGESAGGLRVSDWVFMAEDRGAAVQGEAPAATPRSAATASSSRVK